MSNRIAFYKTRALDAMIAQRKVHQELARDLFVKSVLLGSRALSLASKLPFPDSYSSIARNAEHLVDEEYRYLPGRALEVRADDLNITANEAFDNIGLQMDIESLAREPLNSL